MESGSVQKKMGYGTRSQIRVDYIFHKLNFWAEDVVVMGHWELRMATHSTACVRLELWKNGQLEYEGIVKNGENGGVSVYLFGDKEILTISRDILRAGSLNKLDMTIQFELEREGLAQFKRDMDTFHDFGVADQLSAI